MDRIYRYNSKVSYKPNEGRYLQLDIFYLTHHVFTVF